MQYGYHQIGHRVPRYLAEEFGIDPMSPTAAEDYIRLAKLEPVPVPTKQQASYPGDVITWYVDPKRTQAFKLIITAGASDKLLPRKDRKVPIYVTNLLKEDNDMENWEQVYPVDFMEETKEAMASSDERARVLSILMELVKGAVAANKTDKVTTLGWYFDEAHGENKKIRKELEQVEKWQTIYDSCNMPTLDCDSGYNIIEVGYMPEHYYLAISLNGSWAASALTEYLKVPRGNSQ